MKSRALPLLTYATMTGVLAVTLLSTVACEHHRKVPPLSEEEIRELTADQPQLFIDTGATLTLEGMEDLYLGQSYEDGMEALRSYCGERINVFDGGWRHSDAVFKGCLVDEGSTTITLRAGFWPFNDNRVSTLEIRSQRVSLPVVRARFTELSDELTMDLPRRGLLQMANSRYRLVANWDEGLDQPAHITVGYHPP
jgi:hypothetical protein